jgi:hypothetical protein
MDIDLNDLWHRIVNQVKTEKPLIGSCVERGVPLKLTDHSLIVSFSNKFDKEATEKLRKLIEDELHQIIKRPMRLDCKMNTETGNIKPQEKPKTVKSSSIPETNSKGLINQAPTSNINEKFKEVIDKEPTLKKIVEMFDGEIISIE